jgi:hypothetical protein
LVQGVHLSPSLSSRPPRPRPRPRSPRPRPRSPSSVGFRFNGLSLLTPQEGSVVQDVSHSGIQHRGLWVQGARFRVGGLRDDGRGAERRRYSPRPRSPRSPRPRSPPRSPPLKPRPKPPRSPPPPRSAIFYICGTRRGERKQGGKARTMGRREVRVGREFRMGVEKEERKRGRSEPAQCVRVQLFLLRVVHWCAAKIQTPKNNRHPSSRRVSVGARVDARGILRG